jgi:hypothetical protein
MTEITNKLATDGDFKVDFAAERQIIINRRE